MSFDQVATTISNRVICTSSFEQIDQYLQSFSQQQKRGHHPIILINATQKDHDPTSILNWRAVPQHQYYFFPKHNKNDNFIKECADPVFWILNHYWKEDTNAQIVLYNRQNAISCLTYFIMQKHKLSLLDAIANTADHMHATKEEQDCTKDDLSCLLINKNCF